MGVSKFFESLFGQADNQRGTIINIINSPHARVGTQFIESFQAGATPETYIPWTALNPMEVENHQVQSKQWELPAPGYLSP